MVLPQAVMQLQLDLCPQPLLLQETLKVEDSPDRSWLALSMQYHWVTLRALLQAKAKLLAADWPPSPRLRRPERRPLLVARDLTR